MKKFSNNRGGGFIKMIILIVAGLVLLKYLYDIDIIGFLTEGRFREILDKIYAFSAEAWTRYREIIMRVLNYIMSWFKK